jgi:calcineurin-like phosphoesterase family protein
LTEADKLVFEQNGQRWPEKYRLCRESVSMMDEEILTNINAMVGVDDVLWILGDFAFGRPDYFNVCRQYRNKIQCRTVNLVFGNHDRPQIAALFNEAHEKVTIHVNGKVLVLDHTANAIWEDSHFGGYHLYGHSHATAEASLDKAFPSRRSMDVGVDNAYRLFGKFRPFSFEEIDQIMMAKPSDYLNTFVELDQRIIHES